MKIGHFEYKVLLWYIIVLKKPAEDLWVHALCHREVCHSQIWWHWYVYTSLSVMWKYHAMLPQTIPRSAIFVNATWHIKATVLICKKKTPLSWEVPMGVVLISLHPNDHIHCNWFWQNIHTGECQQNIVFLNFKYLQKYFVAKSTSVKEWELSFWSR